MGKQINFYMSENVQNQFIDFLISNNFLFLDNEGNKIDFQNLCMEDMVQISFLSFCLGLQLRCVLFRFLFQEDLVPFLVL